MLTFVRGYDDGRFLMQGVYHFGRYRHCSNCTLLELKHLFDGVKLIGKSCSNCTLLELKQSDTTLINLQFMF